MFSPPCLAFLQLLQQRSQFSYHLGVLRRGRGGAVGVARRCGAPFRRLAGGGGGAFSGGGRGYGQDGRGHSQDGRGGRGHSVEERLQKVDDQGLRAVPAQSQQKADETRDTGTEQWVQSVHSYTTLCGQFTLTPLCQFNQFTLTPLYQFSQFTLIPLYLISSLLHHFISLVNLLLYRFI